MKKIFALVFTVLLMGQWALAEETVGEKAEKTGNDIKRGAVKAGHRTEEAIKTPDKDAKRRAKVKNRVKEAETRTEDKAKEIGNKID